MRHSKEDGGAGRRGDWDREQLAPPWQGGAVTAGLDGDVKVPLKPWRWTCPPHPGVHLGGLWVLPWFTGSADPGNHTGRAYALPLPVTPVGCA